CATAPGATNRTAACTSTRCHGARGGVSGRATFRTPPRPDHSRGQGGGARRGEVLRGCRRCSATDLALSVERGEGTAFVEACRMNGYNFTERVRRALAEARNEAVALGHPYIGPEHELLGLLRDDVGVGIAVLERFDADRHRVADVVRETVDRTKPQRDLIGPDLPYTSRAKKVLDFAMAEAR